MNKPPHINAPHWTELEYSALEVAKDFKDLSLVALQILPRLPQPLGQVCGPISTGGLGSRKANMKKFSQTIQRLHQSGISLFDQSVFEACIYRVVQGEWNREHNSRLLEEFYHPVISSGFIKSLYFIPGWESSHGATWEHAHGKSLGLNIIYLD